MNRRESPRVEVKLKCHVAASRVAPEGCVGETQNISRGGILLLWQAYHDGIAPPQVGDLLSLDIELPAHHEFSRKCIHCQGTVVRVMNGNKETPRIALSVNYMKFRDHNTKTAALPDIDARLGGCNA